MASEPRPLAFLRAAACLAASLICTIAAGQGRKPPPPSFTCVVNGKKIVSDRLIPECNGIEQRELNLPS